MFEKWLVKILIEFQWTVVWLSSENQSNAWFLQEREDRILFPPEINPGQVSTPSGTGDFLGKVTQLLFTLVLLNERGTAMKGKGKLCCAILGRVSVSAALINH